MQFIKNAVGIEVAEVENESTWTKAYKVLIQVEALDAGAIHVFTISR